MEVCMTKLIVGVNDLATTHPNIAAQWHPTMNGDLKACDVIPNSSKNVWWLCDKQHAYQQIIYKRTQRGFNCSYCSGHRVLKGYNDLATINPKVVAEWHPKLNEGLTPYEFTANSGKKVWWICPVGHEYQAVIRDRNQGTGCPSCNHIRQTSFGEQAVLYYVRKLYPDAVGRYKKIFTHDMELDVYIPSIKLGIEFDGCGWHNNKVVTDREIRKYKICKDNGVKLVRFKERVFKKDEDKRKIEIKPRLDVADEIYTIDKVRSGKTNALEAALQYLLDRLDPKSNMWTRRDPRQIHSTVHVDIEKDVLEINKYLTKIDDSLADKRPDILDKWDYEANGYLKPEMFSVSSNYIVRWRCPKCGHKWKSSINSMTREGRRGCAKCSQLERGKTFTRGVVSKRGSLAENMPELAKEWHPVKNGDMTPADVTTGRFKPVWWLCSTCGYEWEASPNNRKKGIGCPHCSGRVAMPGVDDIATVYPDVVNYWDYAKNDNVHPEECLPGSGHKVAWICRNCNHEWIQIIRRRIISPYYCPKCKNRKND